MLKEHDYIVTLVEKDGHPIGSKGCIVSFYADGLACECEILNEKDYPIDVVTYELNEIQSLERSNNSIREGIKTD